MSSCQERGILAVIRCWRLGNIRIRLRSSISVARFAVWAADNMDPLRGQTSSMCWDDASTCEKWRWPIPLRIPMGQEFGASKLLLQMPLLGVSNVSLNISRHQGFVEQADFGS
ncbi:hypothetical protein MGYG_04174 [Nannizzia gypsea CBS 118893]|uniref:Uncharacterized protein n=1 Tax=Arthroderma gypseum (strain ATCC MYA-4604 / CBS 118893) TaxID=535722 RepID=E4UV53_ARTGP|nr:hypothetical protein MGYG_04174 [Nannizzia gypsea CBS 118893]EFR01170.1 hypothetical protein MGYG_04174 [Nannizzia gypsea CBS 118893]